MRSAGGTRRVRRAGLAGFFATALATVLCGRAVAAQPALPTAPPAPSQVPAGPLPALPPVPLADPGLGLQTGAPEPACTFPPLGPTEVRLVYTSPAAVSGQNAATEVPVTVDPFNPCHIYRLFQKSQPPLVERGDLVNGVVGWTTIFRGTQGHAAGAPGALTPVSTSFPSSLVAVPAPSQVFFTVGGVTAPTDVAFSGDGGGHWEDRSSGLAPIVGLSTSTTPQPVFAPSDASTGFLIRPADPVLYRTVDAGKTWTVVATPGGVRAAEIAFDPADGRHVFLLNTATTSSVWESTDAGDQWRSVLLPPSMLGAGGAILQVVVAHPPGAAAAMYVEVSPGTGASVAGTRVWWRASSADDQFSPLPLPGASYNDTLVVDAADQHTLVWAQPLLITDPTTNTSRGAVELVVTRDGVPVSSTPSRMLLGSTYSPPYIALQSDRVGDFFLWRDMLTNQGGWYTDLQAFRPTALLPGSTVSTASASPQYPPPPTVPTAPRVRSCPLAATAGPGAKDANYAYTSGTLAFDGLYLDYGQDDVKGTIFRMRGDCTPGPSLTLNATDFGGLPPTIDELSYDPFYTFPDGTPGAILMAAPVGFDNRVRPDQTPIYAVNPLSGRATLLLGANAYYNDYGIVASDPLPAGPGSGDPIFSWDLFRNALWSIGSGSNGQDAPGMLQLDGTFTQNCMTAFLNPFTGFGSGGPPYGTSAIVTGGDGVTYVQEEDDQTVYRVDNRTCTVLGGFQHSQYSESNDENDQMACDPISFSDVVGNAGFSALWLRDATPNLGGAYQVPDAYCPFPTEMKYVGTTLAAAGTPVDLCVTLAAATAGTRRPLQQQTVTIALNGTDVGTAITDVHGRACRVSTAPARSGAYMVAGRFAGTHAYLPSTTSGLLTVTPLSPVAAAAGPRIAGIAPPPQSSPGSSTTPSVEGSTQVEAQAQMQAQSQAQTQSVSQVQPGVMVQPQRRTQMAMQTSALPDTQVQLAVRRAVAPAGLMAGQLGGAALLLGLALTRIRPAKRLARSKLTRRSQ